MSLPPEYENLSDAEALERIRGVLRENSTPHWQMPPEFAFRYAYEIAKMPPAAAYRRAQQMIMDVHKHNADEVKKHEEAEAVKKDLRENPITNAGGRGLKGYIKRIILSALNGTPFSRLDWLEVNDEGLQVYQPFSTVSQRTVKHRDLARGNVVLSVDPANYLDWILGFLRQFRGNVPVPIGEIVVYEPGSGRTIGSAVARRPDRKVQAMKDALAQLHKAENPYDSFQRVPRLEDFFVYYDVDGWERMQQGNSDVDVLNSTAP